jgi:hypothetical protein
MSSFRILPRYAVMVLVSAALLMSPRATAGPDDCLAFCWSEYLSCRAAPQSRSSVCIADYNLCVHRCWTGTQSSLPPASVTFDFNPVQVGTTTPPWVMAFYNNTSGRGLFSRDKATLYASWSPPIRADIGQHSTGELAGFSLAYGQRWELQAGERQYVAVNFTPAEAGASSAFLYMWWDHRGSFSWQGIYEFRGTGVAPADFVPPPPTDATITVYITASGDRYHNATCRYVRKSKLPISLKDAKARGYKPCSRCKPPK